MLGRLDNMPEIIKGIRTFGLGVRGLCTRSDSGSISGTMGPVMNECYRFGLRCNKLQVLLSLIDVRCNRHANQAGIHQSLEFITRTQQKGDC